MNKFWLTVSFLFIVSLPATAQVVPKTEVFGGYSIANGQLHGWNASAAGNVNPWLGLVADFSGHYLNLNEDEGREKVRAYTVLFGPQLSLRKGRVVPFTRILLGAARIRSEVAESGRLFVFTDTTFGFAFGGGLDVGLNDRVAIRAFQADYLRTRLFNEAQHTARFSFGLVFRLGRR